MDQNGSGQAASPRREETALSFEEAYARLEQIVARISEEQVTLEETLTLCEEAEALLHDCNSRLSNAERRIEVLLKGKEGQLLANARGEVQTKAFTPQEMDVFSHTPREEDLTHS